MTKIIIPNKEFQKIPYSGTKVAWMKTKDEIEKILYNLRSKGILKKHGWVTEGEADDEYRKEVNRIGPTVFQASWAFQQVWFIKEEEK